MARYPTFEEYEKRGNFSDGIKRCNDLLKKNSNDVQLLTVKLRLVYATGGNGDEILNQLLNLQPPVQDLRELVAIEDAVVASQHNLYPEPKTVGPLMVKLWDSASKASTSMNHKLDLQSLRFSRAVMNNRILDAQQALIQLKALAPRNRTFYMAHAAYTQLLSTEKEDLQSRLALSLARKAVKEKFDDDSALDCRVPGQIFALQSSAEDLESIAERPFKESKQVYDALLGKRQAVEVNGTSETSEKNDPTNTAASDRLATEVRNLKHQFADLVTATAQVTSFLQFAANAVRLFHKASDSLPVGGGRKVADACFLAISSLIKAFADTNNNSYLLQAAYLAETLLKHDPNIHEARVILVYLYMRLELGSLAIHNFDYLAVKEIQHDTIGHALITRLSLVHPDAIQLTKKEKFVPEKRISHALNVYTRHEEKLAETEASVLNHGQTGMIFDLEELRENLRSSLTRRIILLEQRRTERLLHGAPFENVTPLGPRVTANWLKTTDNRDFNATFDYGFNVEKVLHGHNGVLPGKQWILYTLAADSAWCLATGSSPPVNDLETLVEEISNVAVDFGRLRLDENEDVSSELNDAEFLAGDLACQVLQMLVNLSAKSGGLAKDVESVQKAVERLNVDALTSTELEFPGRLKDHYTYLDVLRTVIRACGFVLKQSDECKSELQQLQDTSRRYCETIKRRAKEQVTKITAQATMNLLQEDEDLKDAIGLFGKEGLDAFAESIIKSAREGWQDLTKIAVN